MFKFLKEKLKKTLKKISGKSEEIEEISEKKLEEKEKETKEKIKEKKEEKEIEKVEEKVKETKEKKGILGKLKEKLSHKITEKEFEEFFQDLEKILIENNISLKIIDDIKEELSKKIVGMSIKKEELSKKIEEMLKKYFEDILIEPFDFIEKIKEKKEKPFVVVFFGINGVGKTSTIAKIANLLKKDKLSVLLAASDTFRAASIEQLEKHASALNIKLIKHSYGSDPAAVAFDAIAHAKARSIDVVLIDTAGRMHTQSDLMREMKKICKVAKPDLKVFVGESIVGNDVIEQASTFNELIGIDASILTKADVDEKGGAMISIGKITRKPIIYLGTGQKYDDLEKFDPQKIINSIFA